MIKGLHNILFVSNGLKEESLALQQAIQLAYQNKARLEILIIGPPLPKSFAHYQSFYEHFLQELIHKTLAQLIPDAQKRALIPVTVSWDETPAVFIIQYVMRQAHDLLIKAAESHMHGFKALDMTLLRKCPCTLFLYRPPSKKQKGHVAAAIDASNEVAEQQNLNLEILAWADFLKTQYAGPLSVISCWDFPLQQFLSFKSSPEEIEEFLVEEQRRHSHQVQELINLAAMHSKPAVLQRKGDPGELIPEIVVEKHIDVLVMGTIARTGITGFIIGNTAENILQKLNCSLWAIKPKGFISPIKPDSR